MWVSIHSLLLLKCVNSGGGIVLASSIAAPLNLRSVAQNERTLELRSPQVSNELTVANNFWVYRFVVPVMFIHYSRAVPEKCWRKERKSREMQRTRSIFIEKFLVAGAKTLAALCKKERFELSTDTNFCIIRYNI